ncbi:hypothetical protein D3C72_2181410 [compost metagenome]
MTLVDTTRQQVVEARIFRIEAGKVDIVEKTLGPRQVIGLDRRSQGREIEFVAHPERVVFDDAVGLGSIGARALEVVAVRPGDGAP